MSDEYQDARETDEAVDEDQAMDIALRKLVYGIADNDPTECGVVEAAARTVDHVQALEEENEELRQRVVDLRDKTKKMNRAADLYQDISKRSSTVRDRQAGIILRHAARLMTNGGRQEYDSGRIIDVLEGAEEQIHRSNTYEVMDTAEELVADGDICWKEKESKSSQRNTRLIVTSPDDLPETAGGIRVHEGVLSE